MKYLDLTLPTPEENLACDEALLDACEQGMGSEALRFWEFRRHFVAVGYSNRVGREVNLEACRKLALPILRRCSGGGAVLQGPGCLNYSLILRIDSDPALETVTGTNRFVMARNCQALGMLLSSRNRFVKALPSNSEIRNLKSEVSVCGQTDLALGGRKFSGNAQRRRRHVLLFHGTFLLQFNLHFVSELLTMPSKQPDYRQSRAHGEFLTNLNLSAGEVKEALRQEWKATDESQVFPEAETRKLVEQKYSAHQWNFKF